MTAGPLLPLGPLVECAQHCERHRGDAGLELGRIVHGHPATTNIGFGGDDWKTLFFTSRSTLFSVKLKIAGIPVPVEKRQKT